MPTELEKQSIENEISKTAKSFFQQVEKLDIEGCKGFFENTSDFWSVNQDGTSGDYNTLKKLNGDGFSQMTSFKNTPKREAIRILSNSQVLYTYFTT